MTFASCCGMLTLQVGSSIMATVFFIIAALTLGINVFDYNKHADNSWPVDMFIICIFVVLMVLAGILIFLAAYNESRIACLVAVGAIVLTLMYWLILTIFSLVNQPTDVRRVCAQDRCGATFWLASLKYRTRPEVTDFQTTEDTSHTDYTDEDTNDTPDCYDERFPPFDKPVTYAQPTELTRKPMFLDNDSTAKKPVPTMETSTPTTSKKEQASPTTELSPASSTESTPAAPKPAPEKITTTGSTSFVVDSETTITADPGIDKPTTEPVPTIKRKKRLLGNKQIFNKFGTTVTSFDKSAYPIWYQPFLNMLEKRTPGRKKRLLDNKQVFNNKDKTTVSSFDKTAYPMWYQPFLKMLKEETSKNLLTSLSDMDSDDYESGDEDNSGTEETGEKEETDPTEDGEEEESDTESSQITYGSAFVGAIIFSFINLLFFVFAIIIVWSYAQELKSGPYNYNSQTQSYH